MAGKFHSETERKDRNNAVRQGHTLGFLSVHPSSKGVIKAGLFIVFIFMFLLFSLSSSISASAQNQIQPQSSIISISTLPLTLAIEKQDYIEKYLNLTFTWINDTAWNITWKLDEPVKQKIVACRDNPPCSYASLKDELVPKFNGTLGDFISDIATIDRIPVQALNGAKNHTDKLNYLEGNGSFIVEFAQSGQKIQIGFRTVLIVAVPVNAIRTTSIFVSSNGTLFTVSGASAIILINKSENNGTSWTNASTILSTTLLSSGIDTDNVINIYYISGGFLHRSFNISNDTLSPAHTLTATSPSSVYYPLFRRSGNITFAGQASDGSALRLNESSNNGVDFQTGFIATDRQTGGNLFTMTETPDNFIHLFTGIEGTGAEWNYTNISNVYVQSSVVNLLSDKTVKWLSSTSSLNGTVYATMQEDVLVGNDVIWFARMSNNTKAFTSPVVVANYSDINVSDSEIIIDSATGNLFITFNNLTDYVSNRCQIINSTNDGNTWSSRTNLTVDTGCYRARSAGIYSWLPDGLNSTRRSFIDFVYFNRTSATTISLFYANYSLESLVNPSSITLARVNQTYLGGVRHLNVTVNATNDSFVTVTVDIINPQGIMNITNRTMTLHSKDIYAFSYHSNTTEGNWTVIVYGNTSITSINSTRTSFIIDVINPTPTITRTDDMAGVLRAINITTIILNHNDTNAANWSLYLYRPGGTLHSRHNGTLNVTFQFNSTASDPVGNWTTNLTATDAAGNERNVTDWFGLANYSVVYDIRFEPGNFTSISSAWGNVTAIQNNTAIDMTYVRVSRFSFSGLCPNCSASSEFNLTANFTGTFRVEELRNNANNTMNFTLAAGNLTNFSYVTNLTTVQNLTEETRLRIVVPNALWFQMRNQTDSTLWYSVTNRNVSNDVHIGNLYARVQTLSNWTFDSANQHPRIAFCLSGSNGTAIPPSCTTLSVLTDVTDTNNGNNSDINLFFDGPTATRNIRRFSLNMSDFIFRETIEGSATTGAGGNVGGGGGGLIGPQCSVGQDLVNGTCRKREPCSPGFSLVNDTALNREVCRAIEATLPPLESSRVALVTLVLIVAGIGFIFTQQAKRKSTEARRKRDEMLGF